MSNAPSDDKLLSRAVHMVDWAYDYGAILYSAVSHQCPALKDINIEEWNNYVAILAGFVARSKIRSMAFSIEQIILAEKTMSDKLQERNPNAAAALEACQVYYERELQKPHAERSGSADNPRFLASDVLGDYLLMNILRRPPEENESLAGSIIGMMVLETFYKLWTEGPEDETPK